jgi:hypothetical protein
MSNTSDKRQSVSSRTFSTTTSATSGRASLTIDSGYFYPPQPYPSWVKDEGVWAAPVSMPDDGGRYQWDETNQEWVELSD